MFLKRLGLTGLLVGFGLATSACTDGYGYSGVGVGYGVADGYGYDDPYYGGYGSGYGGFDAYGAGYGGYAPGYFGWYNNFYYPGTGVFVYDRYRRPHRWNDGQRRYWEGRRGAYGNGQTQDNWGGFRGDRDRYHGDRDGNGFRGDRNRFRGDRNGFRGDRSGIREGVATDGQPNPGRGFNRGNRGIRDSGSDRAGGNDRGPRAGSFRGGAGPRVGGPGGGGGPRGGGGFRNGGSRGGGRAATP